MKYIFTRVLRPPPAAVWAAQDVTRRASKRQKDFTHITRKLEAYPQLRDQVPPALLAKLL